jgi:hypothetical protein
METIFLLLTITVHRGMFSRNTDAIKAFTHPPNPYLTFMKAPFGVTLKKGQTIQIVNAINGTMQSAYEWHKLVDQRLKSMGFLASVLDPCLYYKWDGDFVSFVGLYVDDFRIICDRACDLDIIEAQLKEAFPIQTQDDNQWLGMKIVHDRTAGTITISQTKYIEDLLVKFDMVNANPTKTPAEPGSKLKKTTLPPDSVNFPYRELVGNLLWLARTSRPDILCRRSVVCTCIEF